MKKFLFVIITIACFIEVSAQQVAHVNMSELLEILPGKKKVDEEILLKQKTFELELEKMGIDLQTFMEKAQSDIQNNKLTPEQQQALQVEFEKKQSAISEFQQTFSRSIQKQQEAMYDPLLAKLRNAIDAVALKKGVNYVLDASSGFVMVNKGNDLTADVKKELGVL